MPSTRRSYWVRLTSRFLPASVPPTRAVVNQGASGRQPWRRPRRQTGIDGGRGSHAVACCCRGCCRRGRVGGRCGGCHGVGGDTTRGEATPAPTRVEVPARAVVISSPAQAYYRPSGAQEPQLIRLDRKVTRIPVPAGTRVIVTTHTSERREDVAVRGVERERIQRAHPKWDQYQLLISPPAGSQVSIVYPPGPCPAGPKTACFLPVEARMTVG